MSIFKINSASNADIDLSAEPKKFSLLRALLKQIVLATIVGSIVLAAYLAIRAEHDIDKTIGKHAYVITDGQYLGVIKWHGRSIRKGTQIFQIKQNNGELIEVSTSYVEVSDKAPKFD